jgi:hypothetical protein
MMSREQIAERERQLDVIRKGMRRPKKTDVNTDIVLVGGPRHFTQWFMCKIDAKTFSLDRPDAIPGWNPFDGGKGTGLRMRRYLYNVRAIEGMPFLIGDFVACDKW